MFKNIILSQNQINVLIGLLEHEVKHEEIEGLKGTLNMILKKLKDAKDNTTRETEIYTPILDDFSKMRMSKILFFYEKTVSPFQGEDYWEMFEFYNFAEDDDFYSWLEDNELVEEYNEFMQGGLGN